ncbi:2-(S)-hydroxypropyl-CoM dehydrogenase [Nocardioides dokdonensis FR1436]|uniref:2-(S)-hydroxypropyl-CoM dehydrogenase n=1 Tax=Nocardioides dokdonensis FR1436 TaxID=1300347 RepID=A0A1A9GFK6_9ACTN|nr:SDR family NAD(P)-dependent oxidoreductase [Nocardioides dokdonensis]ANH37058.1 2-(S)-hydroxypropyl-CoM dehydrogenase [Nocardioides dokdonensis FR1436]
MTGTTEWSDRVGVVTGGAAGIGRAIVGALVAEGCRVVVVDRDEQAGAAVVAELGERTRFIGGDVADPATADRAVAAAVESFGPPAMLVNVAQASRQAPLLEQDRADFDLALGTGLHATFNFMKAAHPHLLETGGSVVNFASGSGLTGMPTQASYAAAKEAVRGLSRVAAQEWAGDGIRVNVVCPIAATGGVMAWAERFPEEYQGIVAKNPMGRWGDPDQDVAPVVLFLLSDASRYMTGQTLMADGGATMLR